MIELNAPLVAIILTILLALIAGGVAWGSLREKVKQHGKDIDQEVKDRQEATRINKEDHQRFFDKIDKQTSTLNEIKVAIKNGGK